MIGVKSGDEFCLTIFIGGKPHDVTGRKMTPNGYFALCIKSHPNSDNHGYVMEHRVVMEMNIGRYLNRDEIVHHLNDKRYDNRIDNLKTMTQSEHVRLHNLKRGEHNEETKKLIAMKARARLKDRKRHPLYKDIDDDLIKLYKEGLKPSQIAKELNVTPQTVRNKIKYLGVVK